MLTTDKIIQMKNNSEKISMVTAYDYPSAKLVEESNIDMILVGDSLGMVVLGYKSTVEVTLDDMIHHSKAVTRGAPETFVIVDMPFMSYHISEGDAITNARELFQKTGVQAIKIEGASPLTLNIIRRLTEAGIPVVGHIGLTPQSVNVLGGYKVQGKDAASANRLVEEAEKLEKSGVISIVLECVPGPLAEHITKKLTIPTIGIGAGEYCDGQVLVYHDILQYGIDRTPKFVKSYADMNTVIKDAVSSFHKEVKEKTFPKEEHTFKIDDDVINHLYSGE
ncbi:3-methyl-2-oxobutanoate hydroxymethyltransferase [Saliterribacillus persicus]|uniref:3-methyl-2-oxobutanoate hydroxymethyltransferase n=1 Tax=Saliterribacillus persicus TaxID=930114 RepID=A0A368XAQ5_9BACI|nr:3-methyl-2-oxobutanoate hydroxymethyltransferase [Saliterribacillus persicus]RCW64935.1 ketopantoate hydroxymethyltransferase [Saliterribacillus persicus]